MSEYISREALLKRLDMASDCKKCPRCVNMKTYYDRCAYTDIQDVCSVISDMPAADVQPLSVVAEHIKKRLYETAFNTTEEKARNAIADMAGRIDFWIDELKDGDKE